MSGTVVLNHREVTDGLLTQAMEQVQAQAQVPQREILSVIPRSFTLDSQTGIRSPQGMSGNRLDANVHVITGATHAINNVKKCLRLAGIETAVIVPSRLQSVSCCCLISESLVSVLPTSAQEPLMSW